MDTQLNAAARDRVDFSKIKTSIPIPNLIEVQKKSYERFLQMDLLPNEREACKLAQVNDADRAADILSQKVAIVVIKRGSQGALARASKSKFMAPSLNVEAIDHVGAGDSFDAGFLHEFVRGKALEDCLKFGNLLGALSVTRPGGTEAFRDAEYRNEFLHAHGAANDTQDVARAKK